MSLGVPQRPGAMGPTTFVLKHLRITVTARAIDAGLDLSIGRKNYNLIVVPRHARYPTINAGFAFVDFVSDEVASLARKSLEILPLWTIQGAWIEPARTQGIIQSLDRAREHGGDQRHVVILVNGQPVDKETAMAWHSSPHPSTIFWRSRTLSSSLENAACAESSDLK